MFMVIQICELMCCVLVASTNTTLRNMTIAPLGGGGGGGFVGVTVIRGFVIMCKFEFTREILCCVHCINESASPHHSVYWFAFQVICVVVFPRSEHYFFELTNFGALIVGDHAQVLVCLNCPMWFGLSCDCIWWRVCGRVCSVVCVVLADTMGDCRNDMFATGCATLSDSWLADVMGVCLNKPCVLSCWDDS